MRKTAIIWFRRDLRTTNHPAIDYAISHGYEVIPLFIYDDSDPKPPGAASKWWLDKSLRSLNGKLENKLILKSGNPLEILQALIKQQKVDAIFWGRCYDKHSIGRDTEIKSWLKTNDILCKTFNASLLVEPWNITTKTGDFYKVYTPFWRALQSIVKPVNYAYSINDLSFATHPYTSDNLNEWGLHPSSPDWSAGFNWAPGEDEAQSKLDVFLEKKLNGYKANRNYPSMDATSRLSPHLAWGEICSHSIWQATSQYSISTFGHMTDDALHFLSEIAWRDFSYNLLFNFPNLGNEPFKEKFKNFPWQDDDLLFEKWTRGETGFPLIDAGMKELWHRGWMHNRVRMITASFLIKDMLIPWQRGEAWFWDTLVDADHANNAASWQWVAGCGADAAPYFRIFNPTTQAEKFDPGNKYIETYLGKNRYLKPILDHSHARNRALEMLKTLD